MTESPKPQTPLTPASGTSTSMQALSLPSSGRRPSASLVASPSTTATPRAPALDMHRRSGPPSTAATLSAELALTTPTSGDSAVSSAAAPSAAPGHTHGSGVPPHPSSTDSTPSGGAASSFMPDARHMFRRSQVQMVERPQSGRSTAGSPADAQHASTQHGRPSLATQPLSGSSSGSARSLFQAAVANMQARLPPVPGGRPSTRHAHAPRTPCPWRCCPCPCTCGPTRRVPPIGRPGQPRVGPCQRRPHAAAAAAHPSQLVPTCLPACGGAWAHREPACAVLCRAVLCAHCPAVRRTDIHAWDGPSSLWWSHLSAHAWHACRVPPGLSGVVGGSWCAASAAARGAAALLCARRGRSAPQPPRCPHPSSRMVRAV